MREIEAKRIAELVRQLALQDGSICLNIGSSTQYFRTVMQPHITTHLIGPIEQFGIRVINCDLKEDDGVDLVGNVLDPEFRAKLAEQRADVLLCCNILEHLTNPGEFAAACGDLVRPGGYLIVSVPLSYPYHPDPIDTMLRPTPRQIAAFFPNWSLHAAEVITSDTFLEETLRQKNGLRLLTMHVLKAMMPFYRPRHWWPKVHRLFWLWRPYTSSVAVFQKPL